MIKLLIIVVVVFLVTAGINEKYSLAKIKVKGKAVIEKSQTMKKIYHNILEFFK
jgi:hypothetical protein